MAWAVAKDVAAAVAQAEAAGEAAGAAVEAAETDAAEHRDRNVSLMPEKYALMLEHYIIKQKSMSNNENIRQLTEAEESEGSSYPRYYQQGDSK